MNTTYTGSHLRERDQVIQEKYQGEIKNLETKIHRLRYSLDETSKDVFDAVNRGSRLARSLGFDDVYDAQVAVDSADNPITFKEAHERLQMVEAQLAIQKKDTEILQIKLAQAEENAKKAECEKKRVLKEKSELEVRYDDMLVKKERVREKYRVDYQKWKELFKNKHAEDQWRLRYEDEPEITPEEQKKRIELIHEHRKKLIKTKDNSSGTKELTSSAPRILINKDKDKENERTPTPISQKRRFGSANLALKSPAKKTTTPTIPLCNTLLKSVTNMAAPSSSPTVFLIDTSAPIRIPLSFQPIPDTIQIKEDPSFTPSPLNPLKARYTRSSSPIPMSHIPNSSDTEEDSQAIPFTTTNSRTGERIVFKVPAPPTMARLSRQNAISNPTPLPSLPSRPPFGQTNEQSSKSSVAVDQPISNKEPEQSQQVDQDSGRPAKLRRLSENSHEVSRPPFSTKADASLSNSAPRLMNFSSAKGKEREVQNDASVSTPLTVRKFGQKRLEDYSAFFKGRGRYGKGAEEPDQTTINAEYTIDPAKNGGLNFQYDEVVRNKDERRKMNAGDCECCREYYEGIGPLPDRLQQPMWRSPPSTPTKPCPRHSHSGGSPEDDRSRGEPSVTRSVRRQSEIESHKKAISRHRHTWARATTPPAYWDIGFPNTQEVGDINERAKEMHKRKKEQVAMEAIAEGGRYRRK